MFPDIKRLMKLAKPRPPEELTRPKLSERRRRNIRIGAEGKVIEGKRYFYKTSCRTKGEARRIARGLRESGSKTKITGRPGDWLVFYR